MSVVIPPGYASAAIEMRADGDPGPWYITFGVDLSEAGGDYDAVLNTIAHAWENTFGENLTNQAVTSAYILTIGQDAADNLIVRRDVNVRSQSDTPKLPQNCALLVAKNTELGGRKNRGRFFLPGVLNEGAVNNIGVIDPGVVSAFQIQATQMKNDMLLGGTPDGVKCPMVILHNAGAGTTPPPTPVVSLSVSSVIATQRRRLR